MLSIEPVVLQELRVVHVVWVVSRHWKIAETHHLFGGVDHQRAVDAGSLRLRRILWKQRILRHRADILNKYETDNKINMCILFKTAP